MSGVGIFKRLFGGRSEGPRPAGGAAAEKAWRDHINDSVIFRNLPPGKVEIVLARLVSVQVKAGQAIVREGEMGDAFYIVVTGRARVTRKVEDGAAPVELAVLGSGAGFGEESLISKGRRNATVEMIADGVVLKLKKDDFDALLKAPKLTWVSAAEAAKRVRAGACLLDVRPLAESQVASLARAVPLPLSDLRARVGALDPAQAFICCCRTGRISATAAYLLAQSGFGNIAILRGGLQRLAGWGE